MTMYSLKWLPRSIKSYRRILCYLTKEWGQKVLNDFIDNTDRNLLHLSRGIVTGMSSDKANGIHRVLITKHNYLIYRVRPRKKEIELLAFWDTRQDPNKKKY
jgi:plasmid stabilization system protein ParE